MRTRSISRSDALVLLELINDSLACVSEIRMRELLNRFGELLPCRTSASCIGKFGAFDKLENFQTINVNYPIEHLADHIDVDLIWKDPIGIDYLKCGSFKLRCWADIVKQLVSTKTADHLLRKVGHCLDRISEDCGYSYGVVNHKQTEGSLFVYHGLHYSKRTEDLLDLVIPHFHEAIRRFNNVSTKTTSLTRKETEVLKWVKEGKKTWDISTILGISERTVKFHISNIMQKLDASSRTHAVAKAMQQGLLFME